MSEKLELTKDTEVVFKDKGLIRRRFYLKKESLLYLDTLALNQNQSPSVLLDSILSALAEKEKQSEGGQVR